MPSNPPEPKQNAESEQLSQASSNQEASEGNDTHTEGTLVSSDDGETLSIPIDKIRELRVEEGEQGEQGHFVAFQKSHHGPLPSPETLQQYEAIRPGTMDLIVNQFDNEVKHRQDIENRLVNAQIEDTKEGRRQESLGRLCALGIVSGAIVLAAAIALLNPTTPGAVIGSALVGAPMAAIAVAMIKNRKIEHEADEKE